MRRENEERIVARGEVIEDPKMLGFQDGEAKTLGTWQNDSS